MRYRETCSVRGKPETHDCGAQAIVLAVQQEALTARFALWSTHGQQPRACVFARKRTRWGSQMFLRRAH